LPESTVVVGRNPGNSSPLTAALTVETGGVLNIAGRAAPSIAVFEGAFEARSNSQLNLTVHGQPSLIAPSLLVGSVVSMTNSSARISNSVSRIRADFPNWMPTKPGETAALVVAGRISGEGNLLPLARDSFSVMPGNSDFKLMPETIRTGCNAFIDAYTGCGTDVFGVRAVKSVSSGPMPFPASIPTLVTASQAKEFVVSPRSIIGARLARDVYSLPSTPVSGELSRIELMD